ncbi:oxidoreductase [Actinokineospora enzanensis]|uniref:oxidoreductase n=1 Tax=Actinokineospora enzanensis TaxID=155975 RepID=UPI00036D4B55|nr:oxidoreductase [Actinokineospora enzanensis]
MRWSESDIPPQDGRTVLVTGANSGLGLRTARVLSSRGAHVLMACRSRERGRAALATIDGPAELLDLDLADLSSVRAAAAEVRERTGDRLHVLINNAGVLGGAGRTTVDGFDLRFGTNHLGHAALTWLLMPALRAVPGARVVTVSSVAHRGGRLDLTEQARSGYAQSKLANLVFAMELDRRAAAAGLDLVSVAAHPGITATELAGNTALLHVGGGTGRAVAATLRAGYRLVGQSAARGALPQLYAATAPDVVGGEYFGPTGPGEAFGGPGRAQPSRAAVDPALGRTLWARTAELTGVSPDPA